ncbi:MAG: hypothetical protein CSA55_00140 [Ilumatobacter coccineus]|uniref:PpiC domain-containing protein n=1 Tax=Ilumatobacter coccineus TaxID=467094 RepID=A0A2G6KGM5_9ACTN|nr:MAG: hypothetical protein CSA55_00140 [Ilumatobacter coccineus]
MSRIRSLIRPALVTAGLVTALSGCGTAPVATVNGVEITASELDDVLTASATYNNPTATVPDGGITAPNEVRRTARNLIVQELLQSFLTARDVDLKAARADYLTSSLPEDDPLRSAPDNVQELIIDTQSSLPIELIDGTERPSDDELAALYHDDPTRLGVICVAVHQVDTEAAAHDLIASIRRGEAVEPARTPECTNIGDALNAYGRDPISTLLDTIEGGVVGPFELGGQWTILVVRPWAEIADEIDSLYTAISAGRYLFDGFIANADIEVNPRYGRWEWSTLSIEPIT